MKRTFTNHELIHLAECISRLSESDTKLPCELHWKLKLNKKSLSAPMSLYTECEKEIMESYAGDDKSRLVEDEAVDENGARNTRRVLKPEFLYEFQNQMIELRSQKTEVEIQTISYELLKDLSLSSAEWDAVEFMIAES